MTQSPIRTARVVTSLPEAIALMRSAGLRLSSSRRLLLERLFGASAPLSAEQLAGGDGDALPAADLKSVYRNLEALERLGVVQHVHLGHGPGRYALTGRAGADYLVCERCGSATALDPAALDPVRELLADRFGFSARFHHFPITGLCAACRS